VEGIDVAKPGKLRKMSLLNKEQFANMNR